MDKSATVPDMEQAVLDNPSDRHMWIKLAYKKMHEARCVSLSLSTVSLYTSVTQN